MTMYDKFWDAMNEQAVVYGRYPSDGVSVSVEVVEEELDDFQEMMNSAGHWWEMSEDGSRIHISVYEPGNYPIHL